MIIGRKDAKKPKDKRPSDRGDIPKHLIEESTITVKAPPPKKKKIKIFKKIKKSKIIDKKPLTSKEITKSKNKSIKRDSDISKKTVINNSRGKIREKKPRKEKLKEPIKVSSIIRENKPEKISNIPCNDHNVIEIKIENSGLMKKKKPVRPSLRKDGIKSVIKKNNQKLNKKKTKTPSKRKDLRVLSSIKSVEFIERDTKHRSTPLSSNISVKNPIENRKNKIPKHKMPKSKIPKDKSPKSKKPR